MPRTPKGQNDLLTVSDMAMRIFRTASKKHCDEILAVVETLGQRELLNHPDINIGRVSRATLLDKCATQGSSSPVWLMDERIEPILREKLKAAEFLPSHQLFFISEGRLHKTYSCFGHNAQRPFQRQALHEALEALRERGYADVPFNDKGELKRKPANECIVYAKRGNTTGLFLDPRLKACPELAEDKMVARAQDLMSAAQKNEQGKPAYPSSQQLKWFTPSQAAGKLGYIYRNARTVKEVEMQMIGLYEAGNPAVGLFMQHSMREGVYRIDPNALESLKREPLDAILCTLPPRSDREVE